MYWLSRFFPVRRGVLFIGGYYFRPLARALWVAPLAGFVFSIVHPTIAAWYGVGGSFSIGFASLICYLPAMRRLLLGPFFGILLASAFSSIIKFDLTPMGAGLGAYAIFALLLKPSRAMRNLVAALLVVCASLAFFQAVAEPTSLLSLHSTMGSDLLDRYRPISIFPSQIYYTQLILVMVPLFLLTAERRIWVMAIYGFAGAVSGAKGAIIAVHLSLLLGVRSKSYFAWVTLILTLAGMWLLDPARMIYDFSADTIYRSFLTNRLEVSLRNPQTVGVDIAANDLITQFTYLVAIGGLLLATNVIFLRRHSISTITAYGGGIIAVFSTQAIHSTIGSFYFQIVLAIMAVITWHLMRKPVYAGSVRRAMVDG